jgi:hypothetical protein
MEEHHQIPLWFFIGALLLFYGILIVIAGVYYLYFPPEEIRRILKSTVEADVAKIRIWNLHPGIWWGALLTIIGAIYCLRFNPWWDKKSKESL